MTREELEKRFESAEKQMIGLQDEFQNLKTKLAEMQDEPEIPIPDILDYKFLNSEEMAKEFSNKCELLAKMFHCKWYLDRNFVPDWDNCDDKFTVWYNHADNEWAIDFQEIHEVTSIYFSTEEKAQKCADWLNKHWRDSDE